MSLARRLVLGTAQVGLEYGVSNTAGAMTDAVVDALLDAARQVGLDTLDTAEAYGSAHARLGARDLDGLRLITKLAPLGDTLPDSLIPRVAALGKTLNHPIEALLLHDAGDLLRHGDALWDQLEAVKSAGLARAIGVSTYTPAETATLAARHPLDIVQLPLCPLDNRWGDTLAQLRRQGVEIHARSLFLQGLLLMSPGAVDARFDPWRPLLMAWHAHCADQGQTPLARALSAAQSAPLDRLVIGVQSARELLEILETETKPAPLPPHLLTDDPGLLNPALWSPK